MRRDDLEYDRSETVSKNLSNTQRKKGCLACERYCFIATISRREMVRFV